MSPSRQVRVSRYDFDSPRLYVDAALSSGVAFPLTREAANYTGNVLRMRSGDTLLVFNGRDGEWRATLDLSQKKAAIATPRVCARAQDGAGFIHYMFAPLKHARLDYMVQKAVEMGAGRLSPVLTRRTQVHRVNGERMRANAIEAAEQCGILSLPDIDDPAPLDAVLAAWPAQRPLVFCDEDAAVADPVAALRSRLARIVAPMPWGVLVGPEGGFDPRERAAILELPGAIALSLGPRILRADTAAVAAMAAVQAAVGDWLAPR